MTSKDGACLIDRLYELSNKIEADYYISINGDEPLIENEIIPNVIPKEANNQETGGSRVNAGNFGIR